MSVLSCDVENEDSIESHNHNNDRVGQMCPICLDDYVVGDEVSFSKYQTCRHAFHKGCIEGWLKQLDREGLCPFCRGPYLKSTEEELNEKEDISIMPIESQIDLESQQATPVDRGSQCEECGEKLTKPVNSEALAEGTAKNKTTYTSFCTVHGLLR